MQLSQNTKRANLNMILLTRADHTTSYSYPTEVLQWGPTGQYVNSCSYIYQRLMPSAVLETG